MFLASRLGVFSDGGGGTGGKKGRHGSRETSLFVLEPEEAKKGEGRFFSFFFFLFFFFFFSEGKRKRGTSIFAPHSASGKTLRNKLKRKKKGSLEIYKPGQRGQPGGAGLPKEKGGKNSCVPFIYFREMTKQGWEINFSMLEKRGGKKAKGAPPNSLSFSR